MRARVVTDIVLHLYLIGLLRVLTLQVMRLQPVLWEGRVQRVDGFGTGRIGEHTSPTLFDASSFLVSDELIERRLGNGDV